MKNIVKNLFSVFFETLYPARCFLCQESVVLNGFCVLCYEQLGIQTIYTHVKNISGISASFYQGPMKSLILRYKYQDEPSLAEIFASFMLQSARCLIENSDAFVPVPMHWRRRFKRCYNQSSLLSYKLSKLTKKPVWDCLQKVCYTPNQGKKTYFERFNNIKGSFRVSPSFTSKLPYKKVLVIDDVLASGATVYHTASLLMPYQCEVSFLTLAASKASVKES
jgi:ComF family protein